MNLKELRFRKGLTQFDLRIRTGIHQSKISLVESGYMQLRDEERRKLAKVFGVRPEEIECGNGRMG